MQLLKFIIHFSLGARIGHLSHLGEEMACRILAFRELRLIPMYASLRLLIPFDSLLVWI
jgi:hypothetical protein